MWEPETERFAAIKEAELSLLSSDTRRDPAKVRGLLHRDFAEIGRSGRHWTADDIVAALADESDRAVPQTDDWAFNEVAPGIVLVTFRIRTSETESRHSSLWDVRSGAPMLRFHQGTVVPSDTRT